MDLLQLFLIILAIAIVLSVFGFGGASNIAFGGLEMIIGIILFLIIIAVILKVSGHL